MKVSGDTLLKHIRSFTFKGATTLKILSVDDFPFRRGRRWGTVLVDLERHSLWIFSRTGVQKRSQVGSGSMPVWR